MSDNIMGIMRNKNKVLDIRNKINSYFDYEKCTYKYYINLYQDKLEIIEVSLFNCQVITHTAEGFKDFVQLLPNLKYLDLSVTHANGSGHDVMANVIKKLVNKGVIVDMRSVGINIRNQLKDFTRENLYKTHDHEFKIICNDCIPDETGRLPETKCIRCEGVDKVGNSVWRVIYKDLSDTEITLDDINEVSAKISKIISNIPDYVVDEVYLYLLHNNIGYFNNNYNNNNNNKITKTNVKIALIQYLNDFSITLTDKTTLENEYTGIIFSLFDLGDYGDISWMFGWKSLFKCDAWGLCFDIVETSILYNLINPNK